MAPCGWGEGPWLRRAYSIAGLVRHGEGALVRLIYRVVGECTRWMAGLSEGHAISVLGPLGNRFPIRQAKRHAWLVAGGVGLPPMLWLAEHVARAGRDAVAFCGSQRRSLLPLTIDDSMVVDPSGRSACGCAKEMAAWNVPVVVSTDDGSFGYHGYVGSAMRAYHEAHPIDASDLVVYACGPEPMMRQVADYCVARAIECHVCMERSMACGLGTCQSCVVPVHDPDDADGWSYRLCCTEGPVFDARAIIWESSPSPHPFPKVNA